MWVDDVLIEGICRMLSSKEGFRKDFRLRKMGVQADIVYLEIFISVRFFSEFKRNVPYWQVYK